MNTSDIYSNHEIKQFVSSLYPHSISDDELVELSRHGYDIEEITDTNDRLRDKERREAIELKIYSLRREAIKLELKLREEDSRIAAIIYKIAIGEPVGINDFLSVAGAYVMFAYRKTFKVNMAKYGVCSIAFNLRDNTDILFKSVYPRRIAKISRAEVHNNIRDIILLISPVLAYQTVNQRHTMYGKQ